MMNLIGLPHICENLKQAWGMENSSVEESEIWIDKRVNLIAIKRQVFSSSYFCRFYNIFRRMTEMISNSWLLYHQGFFSLANKKLSIGNGKYRSICEVPTFSTNYVFITDPNIMRAVLSHERNETDLDGFFLGGVPTQVSRKILGENLLSYPADQHRCFRKAILTHFSQVSQFTSIIQTIVKKRINQWSEYMHEPFKFSSTLPCLIVEAVCRCFLRYEGPFEEITKSIDTLLKLVTKNKKTEKENADYLSALEALNSYAQEALRAYEENPLFQSVEKDHLTSFVKLMFFAGQDTTAALIEYIVLTLGQAEYKHWQETIYQKWNQFRNGPNEHLFALPELDWIVKEALRLHPPSFEQTRYVKQDLLLDETYKISQGSELHLFHLYAQRDSRRWGADVEAFNPLRHQNKNDKQIMYPFSLGPTACIGKQFAVHLVKIFMMMLISEFKWTSISELKKVQGTLALKILPAPEIILEKRNNDKYFYE